MNPGQDGFIRDPPDVGLGEKQVVVKNRGEAELAGLGIAAVEFLPNGMGNVHAA